tara:strand:+ start:1074 stop:1406 length:333 start_codon:yes stop_codon:yes gene_type:complete
MHWERDWEKRHYKKEAENIYDAKLTLHRSDEGCISTDLVNSPAHYTRGSSEAITIIEEAIQDSDNPVMGMLHSQVLKYLLRLWLKENPLQDAKKAQWYLNRLIEKLEEDN